ncbi:MAG: EAL domain-containing protein (putative c-di-GMP-specific phosphodiesterase class I) [Kiritimatiellia bacterium]|jgi:EAL domain-containing protein (putative c-di-GMP-specific phosphodiesterase class I)/GGDEF domain-containing protein
MTLQRRIILAVIILILFLLGANLAITLNNARLNIYEQLKVHAQDTATSLGFSLSQAALDKDDVQMALMVDAIFDRGYYRRILFRDIEGKEKIKRELPLSSAEVPSWFVNWLPLPESSGSAQVTSGWYQLGEIEVTSHPGFAYQDLWRSFKEQIWLFLITIVLCYGLLGLGLRIVLQPLKRVEEQADAICRKEFPVQESLPNIPELRSVVSAMNRMVEKVKEMFTYHVELNERLYEQLNTDVVTGLSNRQDFDRHFTSSLASDRAAASGALLLVRAGDLQAMNMQMGREEGDEYLRCIGVALLGSLKKSLTMGNDYLLSRHSGADFAVFVASINEVESQELMEAMHASLQELEWQNGEMEAMYIGALYIPQLTAAVNFMALADTALSQAESEGESSCYWRKVDKGESSLAAGDWSKLIKKALTKKTFLFHFQPVWQLIHGQKTLLFNEIMTRMQVDDVEYAAGAFMPMAARFDLLPSIDALVLGKLVGGLRVLPENICINCSIVSIEDQEFMAVLERLLSENELLAPRLTFELPANGLSFAEKSVRSFATTIKKYGAKLSLHHFGRGNAEFAYLQTLPVDYLKIDRHFIQSVVTDADTRFFIRSLVAIASGCDIVILAEGVETEEQWQALIDLGIQGGQGYWLGKPSSEHIIG